MLDYSSLTSNSDKLLYWNIVATTAAVLLAPVVAIWVGELLRKRSDSKAAKLALFTTLIGHRYDLAASESFRALNSIDAVFIGDTAVREAWSRYYAVLNDGGLNNAPGYSIREEKRRELLLEMARTLNWSNNISTADILRAYQPQTVADDTRLKMLERSVRLEKARRDAEDLGIDPSQWGPFELPPRQPGPPGATPPEGKKRKNY